MMRRRWVSAAVGACLFLALAGCGSSGTNTTGNESNSSSGTGGSGTGGASADSSSVSSSAGSATTPTDVSSGTSTATSQDGTASDASGTIAFLMPCSTCAARFENQDKPDFIEAVKKLAPDVEVIANNAEGSSATQISQTENALTNGAKVIVVSPLDESTGKAIVSKAKAANVPVIAYDGLLSGAEIQFYVSFDPTEVGKLQGQYLVDHVPEGSNIVMINGDQTADTGRNFKKGAHEALDPAFDSGKLTLGYEADTTKFDPSKAQSEMAAALTKLANKVGGVLVANDGMAAGVVAALKSQKMAGDVAVTGQDATIAGLQRILTGTQSMTVYKSIPQEAQVAAKVAVGLLEGNSDVIDTVATSSVDNGAGKVPSTLLKPQVVTKSNVDVVVADGGATWDEVCKNIPESACPKL